MRIDWISKLRHLLQTWAIALTVSALLYAMRPDQPYQVPLLYSLCISSITWAVIDVGRHFAPSAVETGWPTGWVGIALPMAGIAIGYLLGSWIADSYFGWSSWERASGGRLAVSLIVTALAGTAGTYYFYSLNKRAWLEKGMKEARGQATESRLKLLEAQLEPHLLFNTLANLRALIATDPPRAVAMLDRLNDFLRATLGASRATTHPLQAEFDRLRDYLELMAVRMGPRLRYTLDLPPDLAACPVPTLLLQPCVENAIKHGLEPKVEGGEITIAARRDGGDVVLEVTDTGIGLSTGKGGGSGFGLEQVHDRLETLYGGRGAMKLIAREQGGTRCTARFPSEI